MNTNIRKVQCGQAGFTLVETLAAIALITIAIVAPMALTVQSLEAAYYARDQITASNLAQEGIEAVRSVRDGNILANALGTATLLFQGILPTPCASGCYVDATAVPNPTITSCIGPCPVLETKAGLYTYQTGNGWTPTNFTRTVGACYVQSTSPYACNSTASDEVRLTVTVSWKTSSYKSEQIQLSENLYNWVQPGSGT